MITYSLYTCRHYPPSVMAVIYNTITDNILYKTFFLRGFINSPLKSPSQVRCMHLDSTALLRWVSYGVLPMVLIILPRFVPLELLNLDIVQWELMFKCFNYFKLKQHFPLLQLPCRTVNCEFISEEKVIIVTYWAR